MLLQNRANDGIIDKRMKFLEGRYEMKKLIALLLALVTCLSLFGCDVYEIFGEEDTTSVLGSIYDPLKVDSPEKSESEKQDTEKSDPQNPSDPEKGEPEKSDPEESDPEKSDPEESDPEKSDPDSGTEDTKPDSQKPNLDVEGHVDADNDKKCDDCSISVVTTFDFYAINDLHGKLITSGNTVGVEGLSTYMKQSAALDDNPIFLSSGDMWQGGSYSNLTSGQIVTEWMNYMGFVSMTLGNHEYDWGEEAIEENAILAEFPLLAINVYDRSTNQRVDYCDSSVLVECRGLQVGIIGAMGDCYSSIASDKVEDVYFKTGSALTSLVKAESERLRDMGADLIVLSLHDGGTGTIGSYYDTALSNGYVDIVFEGHSHYSYVVRDAYGIYHMQNKGDNGGISHAEIEYNFANGRYSVTLAQHVPASEYANLEKDTITDTLYEKYKDTISRADEVLGNNSAVRDADVLRELIAELYLKAGEARWGNQYNIVLGGGFMSARSPGYLHAGTITYGDLQTIFPFDNQIVLCSIKGGDLVNNFLETTNDRYFIYCGDYGESIKNSINSNATYYVVTDTYTSGYTQNRLTEIARYDAGVYARDLLADYIRDGGFDNGGGLTSIPDIISIGMALEAGSLSAESYRVRGEIISVYNTTYGNMIIKDEYGNTLTVYGVSDAYGTRYDGMDNAPQVGDVVTLEGPIKHFTSYSGVTIELYHAYLVE